jgi:hypothetical protein
VPEPALHRAERPPYEGVITLLAAYALLTAAVLAALLLYLRSDAVTSGQKVLAGFKLAGEQTARTLQASSKPCRLPGDPLCSDRRGNGHPNHCAGNFATGKIDRS